MHICTDNCGHDNAEVLLTVVHHRFKKTVINSLIKPLEQQFGNLIRTFKFQIRKLFKFDIVAKSDHAPID